jgi:Ring finger domain
MSLFLQIFSAGQQFFKILKKSFFLQKSAKVLPCGHMYHLGCLREWLQQGQGMRSFTCPICRANLMVDEEQSGQEEEGSIDHVNRVASGRRNHVPHRRHIVRRVPETPSTTEAERRRRREDQGGSIHRRQSFRFAPAAAAENLRAAARATRRSPRPTVAVYYPSIDDPFFIENDEDITGAAVDNNETNNSNQRVSNEIDSWGQDMEVDWDGASCRCHHQEPENNFGRHNHRRNRRRQQEEHHYNNDNSNGHLNGVELFGRGWETDTSGPSSSTVAFHRGFQARRSSRQQSPEYEEEEEDDYGGFVGFAWNLPSSPRIASVSARRPVTRSMSRGL